MMSFSIFDENAGMGLSKDFDEWLEPGEYGGGSDFPIEILPVDFGPVDILPVGIRPGGPLLYPAHYPVVPIDYQPPDIVPQGTTPVQTVGGTGNPVGTIPVSAPVAAITPSGSAPPPAESIAGIDPSLLLIGGAVLLLVLVLK